MIAPEYTPTITVTTPSYNQGEFIEETIVSVLSQQGDFAIEYLIMDGGSTDNSVDIIKKYEDLLRCGKWPLACRGITYRWSSGKDKGQADAVNKGFALATGEILGWLNSDDTYLPGAFQRVADHFRTHPGCALLYGNAYYTDKKGAVTEPYLTEPFSLRRLADYCFICQPSAFIRATALTEVGEVNINLHTCMDYDLWIRLGKKFEADIAFIEEYLATSRMYEENKTVSLREKVYEEGMATVERHFGYVGYWWFDGFIDDIIFGIYLKSKWPSLPQPFRTLLVMPATMRHLSHCPNVRSFPKAAAILGRYLFRRLYSAVVAIRGPANGQN
jgi:glycosyltransferase involved in cell wall biosynthesis